MPINALIVACGVRLILCLIILCLIILCLIIFVGPDGVLTQITSFAVLGI